MQRSVFGRDLYEVFHLDNTTERNDAAWEVISMRSKVEYEKAAQALNVKLGLIPATLRTSLLVYEHGIIAASGVAGLLTCIETYVLPHDRFEVHLIENGRETGYGWYERGANGLLITYEWIGSAEGLAATLNEEHRARSLQPMGGHS